MQYISYQHSEWRNFVLRNYCIQIDMSPLSSSASLSSLLLPSLSLQRPHGPSAPQGSLLGDPAKHILNELKSALLQPWAVLWLLLLLLHHLMIIAAMAALNLYIPIWFCFACD